jgi:hypothetical protein
MKPTHFLRTAIIAIALIAGLSANAQTNSTSPSKTTSMNTYLIEREIPGAGNFTPADLKSISQKSCGVLDEMGPEIKWIHSYVVKDKIYCVYQAANEDLIREHGKQGGFPVTNVMQIEETISPATAENK